MPHDDAVTVGQICDAARRIIRFCSGLDRAGFMADELRQSAIERQLFIIGEAVAGRLSKQFKDAHPDIAWAEMTRMRNILAHGYDFVNLDIIWQTVVEDIPALITTLDPIVGSVDGPTEIDHDDIYR